MQIKIDLSEQDYELACKYPDALYGAYAIAIKNGTPLPKDTCEDAVSRNDVYFMLTNGAYLNETTEQFIDRLIKELKALPPVTPTQKWIPCSEDLPKEAFSCFVTVEEDDIHGEPQRVIYPNFVGYDGETWNDADGKVIPFDVVAWMPLMKPYEAE